MLELIAASIFIASIGILLVGLALIIDTKYFRNGR
jgi:hypothetical protein